MKLRILVPLALCAALCSAQSTAASKEAKVDELFRLSKVESILQRTLQMTTEQVKSSVFQQMMGVKMTPEQQTQFNAFQDKVNKVVMDAFSWEQVKPIYTKAYVQEFSDSELDGIIAFYKTPAGQAMVEKTPKLMTEANTAMQERLKAVGPQVQQLMAEFQQQVKSQPKPQQ